MHEEQGREWVAIVDFGSQYTQLVARVVRELGVYCEVVPCTRAVRVDALLCGVVLSGSPRSVHDAGAPRFNFSDFEGRIPVLGVCYGAQLMAITYGGAVSRSVVREYGRARLARVCSGRLLTDGVRAGDQVWMSHGDTIVRLGDGFCVEASTEQIPIAIFDDAERKLYGVQFHPEVSHTAIGRTIFKNFLVKICHCVCDWTPRAFATQTIASLREELGQDEVVLGLSGGVDSSVAGLLLHKAIGDRLTCVFIDHGLLREGEYEGVLSSYRGLGLNVVGVDASDHFFRELAGVTDPESKRKIIGRCFVEEFDMAAAELKDVKWLAQGTIYPDVIESSAVPGASVTIKSHHNVGGLPKEMVLQVVEPLRQLFKDEVRRVGAELGLPQSILGRHPFPGPGLAIRVLGEVTRERVKVLQAADAIFIRMLREAGEYDKIWQAGAILLPVRSVGVMGDERSYENVVALRAVTSVDGMTADWYPLPYDLMAAISNAIINGVRGVNRVVYDVSSKPPATIEWE